MTNIGQENRNQSDRNETFKYHKTLEERAASYGGDLGLDGEDAWYTPLESEKW